MKRLYAAIIALTITLTATAQSPSEVATTYAERVATVILKGGSSEAYNIGTEVGEYIATLDVWGVESFVESFEQKLTELLIAEGVGEEDAQIIIEGLFEAIVGESSDNTEITIY
jgi:hypothetical protein